MILIGSVYYDSNNLIVQTDKNSGDQAARSGQLYLGRALNRDPKFRTPISFRESLKILEPSEDGNLLRAATPVGFDPLVMPTSRDQTDPNIIASGFYGQREFIKRVFLANLKRGLKYPNGDLMLGNLSTYIRGGFMAGYESLALLYPMLLVSDLAMLANTLVIVGLKARKPGILRRFLAKRLGMWFLIQDYKGDPNNPGSWSSHGDNNVGDDILHIQQAIQSKEALATPISWLSNLIYAKFRPHGVQYALDWYHRPETYSNPLNELYRPLIVKYFE